MKVETKATIGTIIAAFCVSLLMQSCGTSTVDKERPTHNTVKSSRAFVDVQRYEREGEILVLEYEGRRYTMWQPYGSGRSPVILHIQEAKSNAQVYLEKNIIK